MSDIFYSERGDRCLPRECGVDTPCLSCQLSLLLLNDTTTDHAAADAAAADDVAANVDDVVACP